MSGGERIKIDDQDYEFLSQWKWRIGAGGYAVRSGWIDNEGKRKPIFMHRILAGTVGTDFLTDHINGDIFDNRKMNLRACTHSQNNLNRRKFKGTSKFKGVYWKKESRGWISCLTIKGKLKNLGTFDNEEDAAKCYDYHARRFYDLNFVLFNFPDIDELPERRTRKTGPKREEIIFSSGREVLE